MSHNVRTRLLALVCPALNIKLMQAQEIYRNCNKPEKMRQRRRRKPTCRPHLPSLTSIALTSAAEISSTVLKIRQLNVADAPNQLSHSTHKPTRTKYDLDICCCTTSAHNLSVGTCFLWSVGSGAGHGSWTLEDDIVRT